MGLYVCVVKYNVRVILYTSAYFILYISQLLAVSYSLYHTLYCHNKHTV